MIASKAMPFLLRTAEHFCCNPLTTRQIEATGIGLLQHFMHKELAASAAFDREIHRTIRESRTVDGTLCSTMKSPSTRHRRALYLKKVEAAGIEPASRNRSTPASTCVVELFNLAEGRRCRPRCSSASPELF